MKYNNKNEYMLNYFLDFYGSMVEGYDVLDWHTPDPWSIVISFSNGKTYHYDQLTNLIREQQPLDEDGYEELEDETWFNLFRIKLERRMRVCGFNQERFADALGITQPMMSRYLDGKSYPNIIMLKKMAKVLNCHINDLVDF